MKEKDNRFRDQRSPSINKKEQDVGDVDIARTIQDTIAYQKEWSALSAQTWDISQKVVRPTSPLDLLP